MIEKNKGEKIEYGKIPLYDPATYEYLTSGDEEVSKIWINKAIYDIFAYVMDVSPHGGNHHLAQGNVIVFGTGQPFLDHFETSLRRCGCLEHLRQEQGSGFELLPYTVQGRDQILIHNFHLCPILQQFLHRCDGLL